MAHGFDRFRLFDVIFASPDPIANNRRVCKRKRQSRMANARNKPKGPEIGLRQAKRLGQLNPRERLEFIARGLPLILRSAKKFREAGDVIRDNFGREAAVLDGFATEEAAKILILVDAVRCPPKLISSKLKSIVDSFYNHLARLIYAEATSWRPTDLKELRAYVDTARRGHYIEGSAGEYIMPNDTLYDRESRLYVDIEAYQDGTLTWNEPREPVTYAFPFGRSPPTALRVAIAMEQVGRFSPAGLKAASDIWGSLEYKDDQDHHDGEKLTKLMLERLLAEGLPLPTAQQEDVTTLYEHWQIPMYNLDFALIPVSMDELKAAQERELWSTV